MLNSLCTCYINVILFFFFFNNFTYLFLARWSSSLCRLFSGCGGQGQLFVAMLGFLTAVASLAVEHGLEGHGLR